MPAAFALALVATIGGFGYTAYAQSPLSTPTSGASPMFSPTLSPTVTPGTGGTGTGGTGTGTLTPGIPNTGAGGDAAFNLALLMASGIMVVGGATYVVRNTIGLR